MSDDVESIVQEWRVAQREQIKAVRALEKNRAQRAVLSEALTAANVRMQQLDDELRGAIRQETNVS